MSGHENARIVKAGYKACMRVVSSLGETKSGEIGAAAAYCGRAADSIDMLLDGYGSGEGTTLMDDALANMGIWGDRREMAFSFMRLVLRCVSEGEIFKSEPPDEEMVGTVQYFYKACARLVKETGVVPDEIRFLTGDYRV